METIRRCMQDFVFSGLLAVGASGPGMQGLSRGSMNGIQSNSQAWMTVSM